MVSPDVHGCPLYQALKLQRLDAETASVHPCIRALSRSFELLYLKFGALQRLRDFAAHVHDLRHAIPLEFQLTRLRDRQDAATNEM